MSQYNEDWQRRKSYLIRSLFNDIPYRALSPVIEESTLSSNDKHFEQSPQSSDVPYSELSYALSEESGAVAPSAPITSNIISPSVAVSTTLDRPWSPLPPLIIERESYKHDEPPEYYETLLIKIRKIYRKIFLEGRHSSDDDSFKNDYEHNTLTEKNSFDLNSESSFYSNDYSADHESIDSEHSNNVNNRSESILVDNSLNDRTVRYDNIDNTMKLIINERNGEDVGNINGFGDEEMQLDSSVPNEEPNYSQVTVNADVHVDGLPPQQVVPSPVYEEPPSEITSIQNPLSMTQLEPEKQLQGSTMRTTLEAVPVLGEDVPLYGTTQSIGRGDQEDINTSVRKDSPLETTNQQQFEELQPYVTQSPVPEQRLEVSQCLMGGNSCRSPVLKCRRQKPIIERRNVSRHDRTDEPKAVEHRQGAARSQVTSQAEAYTVSQHDKPVDVVPESPTKARYSWPKDGRSLRGNRDLAVLEDLQDSEIMRTPRQNDASLESTPIDNIRLTSDMELTCQHYIIAQDISNVTSQSQDGGHVSGTVEQKISADFDELLSSILNNNCRSRQSINIVDRDEHRARKRSYEGISGQRESVSWNDLRDNFFVGTPKIFRLCSCADHVCC